MSRHKSPGNEIVNQETHVRLPQTYINIFQYNHKFRFQAGHYLHTALLLIFSLRGELSLTVSLLLTCYGLVKESGRSKFGNISHWTTSVKDFIGVLMYL